MPLFQIGYRRYEGRRTSHALRWWPITRTGLTIAWRSKLLRRLVFVSFLPFLYFGWVFFLIGRATDPATGGGQDAVNEIVTNVLGGQIVQQLRDDPAVIRSAVWAMVFAMFGNVQLLIGGLVAAIVGPPLIATDMRSRAFLIYFGRPVSRLDYVIGKAGVMVALLAAVTLLPSLVLYALSILFSPSIDTLLQTAPIALTVLLASLGAVVPATLIVLVISSLTRQPRFATASWIAICFFGPIAHGVLSQTRALSENTWTYLLSLPHTIRALQLGLYDVAERVEVLGIGHQVDDIVASLSSPNPPGRAAAALAVVSVLCLLVLLRRVDAPTRI
jgi:ABC-type transport system involved in multi-copper enzyme maturation permease subunit